MNKWFKITVVFSFLVIGILSFQLLKTQNSLKQLKDNTNNSEITESKLSLLEVLKKADSLILLGQYDNAKKLLSSANKDNITAIDYVNQKFNLIEEFINSSSDISMNMDTVSDDVKQVMKVMSYKNDSIVRVNRKNIDSLHNQISSLREQILDKNVQTQMGNDKIQVITFKGQKGTKIHYLGEVKNGKANGNGVGIWITGSIYKGEWRNNIRHGQGIYEWADGERYEGTYVDGKRQGFGKYYWPNGERYEGQWIDDRRNGKGTLFDPDSNIKFEGNWKEDKPIKK